MMLRQLVMAIAVFSLMIIGCSGAQGNGEGNMDDNGGNGPDTCYVHLFDGDNFDETDDHFILSTPGRYANLRDLPGASKDWTDEADSLKVGPGATVTVWSRENFEGTSQTFEAGSEHPDLDDEPESLELTCN